MLARLRTFLPFACIVQGSLSCATTSSVVVSAGLTLVFNAMVYTGDVAEPWAESFAYDTTGQIIAVGIEEQVRARVEEQEGTEGIVANEIDVGGRLVLPGFVDPHLHVLEAGANENACFVTPGSSMEEYVEELLDYCEVEDGWVRAAGASLYDLRGAEGAGRPLLALDEAFPSTKVLVLDDLGHAVWANSLAMNAAGITSDSPDPPGGVYERDSSGALTGLVLESAQQKLRDAAQPAAAALDGALASSMTRLAENGITTVSDAGGYWTRGHDLAWQRLLEAGLLTVRATNALYLFPDLDPEEQLEQFRSRFTAPTTGTTGEDAAPNLLSFNTAKVYLDGILDLGTGALLAPYDVPPDPSLPAGFTYFTTDALQEYSNALHGIGYVLHFHVIGDAALREALDAVEALPDSPDAIAARRHRTTHTYLVAEEDVSRFEALGVIADFQMAPESISEGYREYIAEFIGDTRARSLIPVKELLDAGARCSLSSDWDADPLSKFGTIHRAVTRARNAVELETAVRLVTLDAAYALGLEQWVGSIEVGKLADFIVTDTNIMEARVGAIEGAKVLLTVLQGAPVFAKGPFRQA
ncbi:unnamed protein product [Chrysoparadoxa australica]